MTIDSDSLLGKCLVCGKPNEGIPFCDVCYAKHQAKAREAIQKATISGSEEATNDVPQDDIDISGEPLQVMNTSDLLKAQQDYTREDHNWAMNDSYWGRNPRDRY